MTKLTPHQKSALEFEEHLSLTANAGSGKTFVLARRYLNAALKDGVSLSNIAAITFTDKAAGELYNKIVKLVNEQIIVSESDKLKHKLEAIRRQLVSANISTIHSFCINILREFPVEAGLDARFAAIDEQLSEELIELSIQEITKELLEDGSSSEELKYLIRILGSKSGLEKELFSLIKQRKNLLIIKDSIYSKPDEEIIRFFNTQFNQIFSQIWNDYDKKLIQSIKSINDLVISKKPDNAFAAEISHLLKKFDSQQSAVQIIRNLSSIKNNLLTGSNTIRKQGYLTSNLREGLDSIIEFIESSLKELSKIEFPEENDEQLNELLKFGKILLEVLSYALKRYEDKKSADGFLDYEDILLFVKEILKKDNVKQSLNEKFKYILVDEYQDTNEIQYEIFLPILNYLKSGNLFIVGDEKQSIYMFRDAELEIFNRTRNDISMEAGSEALLDLPDSFRMSPAICLFTNKLFENLFAEPNPLYNEVQNTNIVCASNQDKNGNIEFLLADTEQENFISEAELVARRIIELKLSGKEFNEIAVLVRKRKSFAGLETEFIKYGIPFSIIGGRGFYQRQSISDIYNYLSFLSNSGNSKALAGILRSPFFTVSDARLFEISLQTGNNFWQKFQLISETDEQLNRIKEILEENIQLASSLELTVLLRKILTDTEYLAVLGARNDGEQELANIEKLIEISRGFGLKGFRNLYDFLDYLNDAITGIEDESQAAITNDLTAVQLMTLHQAKGLEFPVVVLYNAHESSQKTSLKSRQISLSKSFGILTKLPLNNNFLEEYHSAAIGGLYNFIEEKKRIAELKRLLYVGVTRSIERLIISGEYSESKSISTDSFLSMIRSGLDMDLTNEKFILEDDLDFLKLTESGFINELREIKIDIPIKRAVLITEDYKFLTQSRTNNLVFNTTNTEIPLEKDIISATKVAVYSQCPTKYLLTYEYGFGALNSVFNRKEKSTFEIEDKEREIISDEIDEPQTSNKLRSDIKGSLIHFLLEKEFKKEELEDELANYLIKKGYEENEINYFKRDILTDLYKFFNSDIYNFISNHPDYKNEFEVYIKYDSAFLYGIIDKIIFSEGRLVIVDYKTDDIEESELNKRAETYFTQLKFYLLIVQKLFGKFNSFQLILIFIKYPDKPIIKNIDNEQFFLVKKEISDIIKGIIHKQFYKNTEHCQICFFSDKFKKCILNLEKKRDPE